MGIWGKIKRGFSKAGKFVVKTVGKVAKAVINIPNKLIGSLGKAASGILGSLALPLAAGAAVVGFMLLKK